jgi:hypothetical protein
MIKRNNFNKDYKEKLVMEIVSKQSSVAQVAQREKVSEAGKLMNYFFATKSSQKHENYIVDVLIFLCKQHH